jgi:hypothetical protein
MNRQWRIAHAVLLRLDNVSRCNAKLVGHNRRSHWQRTNHYALNRDEISFGAGLGNFLLAKSVMCYVEKLWPIERYYTYGLCAASPGALSRRR